MPRYKCKVDTVFTYEFEVTASSKDTAEIIASNTDVTKLQEVEFNTEVVSIEELPEIAALFTYPTLPENASDRMKEAYKIMLEEINLATFGINTEVRHTTTPGDLVKDLNLESEKVRKQSDTTKITQVHYDGIMAWYKLYLKGEITGVRTTQQLTDFINKQSGLNKSRSVYSKIWNGGVDRESLSKGE